MNASDEQLVRRFADGDREALGTIAARHETGLLGFVRGFLDASEADACDVVQDAWLRVIRHAKSFDGRAGFKTWLYRVALNAARQRQRATIAFRKKHANKREEPQRAGATSSAPPSIEATELDHRVRSALERLSLDERAVLLLCHHSELAREDVAAILQIPAGTLKSRLHRAMQQLRATLGPEAAP